MFQAKGWKPGPVQRTANGSVALECLYHSQCSSTRLRIVANSAQGATLSERM